MISKRLEGVRQIISANKMDAMLINSAENRFYLSGFTGTSGYLLISIDQAFLITDFRYTQQAEAEAEKYEIVRYSDTIQQTTAEIAEKAGWGKIGFEAKKMHWNEYKNLHDSLAAELLPVTEEIEKLRSVKDKNELIKIRRGVLKTDLAFQWILSNIRPGMPEKMLSRELEIFMLQQGADGTSFDYIVASGFRGALPHGVASDKIMQEGDLVTIDFGAVFEGYATDMTRTVALGNPGDSMLEIYEVVRKAQAEAAASIRPGMTGREVDMVARDIISAAGYGDYFGHGLGHGVGLETHESPLLNAKSEAVLEPGMVVTVEPGIYLPGRGGVRIEDMAVVTETGAELLTSSPRELITV